MTQASDKEVGSRALDELFCLTSQYHASQAYGDLLKFIARFRHYSPFNAMLVHIQMPGAVYVAPPHRWLRDWERRIRPGARPLVILQPKGRRLSALRLLAGAGKMIKDKGEDTETS